MLNDTELQKEGALLASQFLVLTEAAGKSGGDSTFLKPLMTAAYQIVRADGSRETPVSAKAECRTQIEMQGHRIHIQAAVGSPFPPHQDYACALQHEQLAWCRLICEAPLLCF